MSPSLWVPGPRLPKAKLLRRVKLTTLRTFSAGIRNEWICASKHFVYLHDVDTFIFTVTFICRARRVLENAFGNLTSRFRVFCEICRSETESNRCDKTFFFCSHKLLQIISRHCLSRGIVDMADLTRQKFNLDDGTGNKVDGLSSANIVIQITVKSSGKHKISAC
jgi:hypothetical protein